MDFKVENINTFARSFAQRMGLVSAPPVQAPAVNHRQMENAVPLSVDGTPQSSAEHAIKMARKDPFLALVAAIEHNPYDPKPHKDPGGHFLDVGYGYCITKRIRAYTDGHGHVDHEKGRKAVFDDLVKAGLSEKDAKTLVVAGDPPKGQKPDYAAAKKVDVPIDIALNLVNVVRDEYEGHARNIYGKAWSKMDDNKRGVVSYLAYKEWSIDQKHPKMLTHARNENWDGFHASISSAYGGGKRDTRAEKYMKSMSDSPESFVMAVMTEAAQNAKAGKPSAGVEEAAANIFIKKEANQPKDSLTAKPSAPKAHI